MAALRKGIKQRVPRCSPKLQGWVSSLTVIMLSSSVRSCLATVPDAAAVCREWIEAAMEAAQKEDSERRKALAAQRKGAREELKKLEEQEVALLVAQ